MNKFEKLFQMINILAIRDSCSVAELCSELGISPRTVKRYKNEMETLGLDVVSTQGRNAGYTLKSSLFNLALSDGQAVLRALQQAIAAAEAEQRFEEAARLTELKTWLHRIPSGSTTHALKAAPVTKPQIASAETGVAQRFIADVNYAIQGRRVLEVKYHSLHRGEISTRRIEPYAVVDYAGMKYVIAYCLKAQDYRIFHFLRCLDYTITSAVYEPRPDFDLDNVVNHFGIIRKESFELILHLYGFRARMAEERKIDESQSIKPIENGVELRAIVQSEEEILSWVLSMGPLAKIVEPQSLRKKAMQYLAQTSVLYADENRGEEPNEK